MRFVRALSSIDGRYLARRYYSPGTDLDHKTSPVLSTFTGLRDDPWVAVATNSLNPVLRLDGQQLTYRVIRPRQRLLSDVLRVDTRSAAPLT